VQVFRLLKRYFGAAGDQRVATPAPCHLQGKQP
jgi:hypothetical protein